MLETPVISNHALHGVPQLIRSALGERVLARATRAAGIDAELIQEQTFFVPHAAVINLIDTAARAAGEANFGLFIAPWTSVTHYGSYGVYVLGAETLGGAINRAIGALGYHSIGDSLSLVIAGDEARFSYGFALKGHRGYEHVVCAAAGALASMGTYYLGTKWRPLRIELDIVKPPPSAPFEDVFQCPVIFDSPTTTVVFGRHHLDAHGPRHRAGPIITIADVARDRRSIAPHDLLGVIQEQVRLQVLSGAVSIDSAARAMDVSIRTLQRELNRQGIDFRTLANATRAQRAAELLRYTDSSITTIAMDLGYSASSNFSRAFRAATGLSPREFRLLG